MCALSFSFAQDLTPPAGFWMCGYIEARPGQYDKRACGTLQDVIANDHVLPGYVDTIVITANAYPNWELGEVLFVAAYTYPDGTTIRYRIVVERAR